MLSNGAVPGNWGRNGTVALPTRSGERNANPETNTHMETIIKTQKELR